MSIYCPLSEALGIPQPDHPIEYDDDIRFFSQPNGKGPLNSFYGKKHTKESKRLMSESQKGEKNHFYGKNHSETTKRTIAEKTSKLKKGIALSARHKTNIADALRGNPHTDERRKNISLSKKGKPTWNKGQTDKIVECPYCGKMGGNSNMKRWHFDNCKEKI
jgi:hypothetical protein